MTLPPICYTRPAFGAVHTVGGFGTFGEELLGSLQGRFDVLHFPILERHRQPLQDTPGSDVATHDAGAYDMDTTRLETGIFAVGFQLFHQPENPSQAA